jgi:type IV secretion system protein VirB11
MNTVALETFLQPINPWLDQDDVSELSINKPRELWIEKRGEMERHIIPELDEEHLIALAKLIAESTRQDISFERPVLSATLPTGHRVQVILPPAAQEICLSIRKPSSIAYTLDDYQKAGAFSSTVWTGLDEPPPWSDPVKPPTLEELGLSVEDLEKFIEEPIPDDQFVQFIRHAVLDRKNILISGGTSTGKTTFLNACLREIPLSERLVTIEDAQEVTLLQPNHVHLLSSRGEQGQAKVTPQQLLEASLRLRPDRIIMGELRGAEAFSFLRAVNTGHPGSIATLHADSPMMAFEQVALMVMQTGLNLKHSQIMAYVKEIIDVVIQLKRGDGGRRYVSEIYDARGRQ